MITFALNWEGNLINTGDFSQKRRSKHHPNIIIIK